MLDCHWRRFSASSGRTIVATSGRKEACLSMTWDLSDFSHLLQRVRNHGLRNSIRASARMAAKSLAGLPDRVSAISATERRFSTTAHASRGRMADDPITRAVSRGAEAAVRAIPAIPQAHGRRQDLHAVERQRKSFAQFPHFRKHRCGGRISPAMSRGGGRAIGEIPAFPQVHGRPSVGDVSDWSPNVCVTIRAGGWLAPMGTTLAARGVLVAIRPEAPGLRKPRKTPEDSGKSLNGRQVFVIERKTGDRGTPETPGAEGGGGPASSLRNSRCHVLEDAAARSPRGPGPDWRLAHARGAGRAVPPRAHSRRLRNFRYRVCLSPGVRLGRRHAGAVIPAICAISAAGSVLAQGALRRGHFRHLRNSRISAGALATAASSERHRAGAGVPFAQFPLLRRGIGCDALPARPTARLRRFRQG